MIYLIAGIIVLLFFVSMMRLLQHKPIKDSVLKQRALFSPKQQQMYVLLKQIFQQQLILTHVNYCALLTTKYLHTREKYCSMNADFIVLDLQFKVRQIINLNDVIHHRQPTLADYEDNVLRAAGYCVLRYDQVPTLTQLQLDLGEMSDSPNAIKTETRASSEHTTLLLQRLP